MQFSLAEKSTMGGHARFCPQQFNPGAWSNFLCNGAWPSIRIVASRYVFPAQLRGRPSNQPAK